MGAYGKKERFMAGFICLHRNGEIRLLCVGFDVALPVMVELENQVLPVSCFDAMERMFFVFPLHQQHHVQVAAAHPDALHVHRVGLYLAFPSLHGRCRKDAA